MPFKLALFNLVLLKIALDKLELGVLIPLKFLLEKLTPAIFNKEIAKDATFDIPLFYSFFITIS